MWVYQAATACTPASPGGVPAAESTGKGETHIDRGSTSCMSWKYSTEILFLEKKNYIYIYIIIIIVITIIIIIIIITIIIMSWKYSTEIFLLEKNYIYI